MHHLERLCSSGKDWEILRLMYYAFADHSGVCTISGLSGTRLDLLSRKYPNSMIDAIQYYAFSKLKAH